MIASMIGSREDAMAAALRVLAFIATLLSLLAATGESSAQTYPTRPVRLVVPFGAGGPTDVIARIVAQKLSEIWGQQVYTENIPGAGGNTGVATVARAPADGYTILVVSTGFMVNPSMYAKVPYDPIKDFSPITLVAASPNVISVNPGFSAKTLKELVDLVKSHPGKYSFRSPPPARRRTSPANCSSNNISSTSSPCPSIAPRWRSIPPSEATPRSRSRRYRRPWPISRMANCAGSPYSAPGVRRHCQTYRLTRKRAFPISRATR